MKANTRMCGLCCILTIVTVLALGCRNTVSSDSSTCEQTCPDVVSEGCTNGPPSVADCESGCLETRQNCPIQFDAVVACGGENPTYSCGDNGTIYPDGCEREQDDLYACLSEVPTFCVATCPYVVNEGCVIGPSSIEDCELGCTEVSADCPAQFNALVQCGGVNATFSCGDNDMVYTDGCETEQDALYLCVSD